ncbi:hypothetical protein HMPREF9946_04452 [Acetobacteraceae bacterium AT-5844]|nr:hypothetical protein HMPREF9946_04452 [Acetobacteraceae bacterium AT-5844]
MTRAFRAAGEANASRARMRSGIEHVFAAQKHRMALFVRTRPGPRR